MKCLHAGYDTAVVLFYTRFTLNMCAQGIHVYTNFQLCTHTLYVPIHNELSSQLNLTALLLIKSLFSVI